MEKVIVNASKKYEILIEEGLLDHIGELIGNICSKSKVLLVSDTNVFPLYGDKVIKSLEDAGYNVTYYVIPAGESSKNRENLFELIDVLAENEFSRSDILVALGGGVVGDLVGFCASIYLRGVRFFQIPTTLLAAVDSSVGGKTAIDITQGKNLVGTFYQPCGVFFDPDVLDTLPDEVYADGMAEVIKYGMILDSELFNEIAVCDKKVGIKQIKRCIELKRDVVGEDEFDEGKRKILNFGHTFGHAIEKASDYTISHGRAVAQGMRIMAKACLSKGICGREDMERLGEVLDKFSLPYIGGFKAEELAGAISLDKKRAGESVSLIVLYEIGRCGIEKYSIEGAIDMLKSGI